MFHISNRRKASTSYHHLQIYQCPIVFPKEKVSHTTVYVHRDAKKMYIHSDPNVNPIDPIHCTTIRSVPSPVKLSAYILATYLLQITTSLPAAATAILSQLVTLVPFLSVTLIASLSEAAVVVELIVVPLQLNLGVPVSLSVLLA